MLLAGCTVFREEGSDSQRLEQTLVLILSSLCPELILVVSWAKRMGRRLQQSCSCAFINFHMEIVSRAPRVWYIAGEAEYFGIKETEV